MKSEHRHDLETNELAKRLAVWIEKAKPYASTVATALIVVLAVILAVTYFNKSSVARQSAAWDAYNLAVEERAIDLEALKQAAEQNAGTPMAEWADITWADGQVHRATRSFMQARGTAMESLEKAEGVYKRQLSSGKDQTLIDRANYGLGKIFEMRNQLDKAREHYLAVQGGFTELAKARAEELESPQAEATCAWLATAEPPLQQSLGGTSPTGTKPEFEVEDFATTSDDQQDGPLLSDLLENFGRENEAQEDRYSEGETADAAADSEQMDEAVDSEQTDEATSSDQTTESTDSEQPKEDSTESQPE